jgi:hypothetical protein
MLINKLFKCSNCEEALTEFMEGESLSEDTKEALMAFAIFMELRRLKLTPKSDYTPSTMRGVDFENLRNILIKENEKCMC